MRVFYDQYSTRLRGEILLLFADALAITTAVLYATGALHEGSRIEDILLVSLWACLPRALAKIVGQLGRSGLGSQAFTASLALVLVTTFLLVAGWELITSATPHAHPMKPASFLVIFLAWASGFLLFHARAYRLHDFFLWSVVLIGILDGRPHPFVWMPVFFVCFFLSCAVRHLLHDSFLKASRPRLNLQNARAVAVLGACAASLLFSGVYLTAHGGLDFPPALTKRTRTSDSSHFASNVHRGDVLRHQKGTEPRLLDPAKPETLAENVKRLRRKVAFTYSIGLRDLTLARFDTREVLRVTAIGEGASSKDWRPHPSMLWKGVSFSQYDAELESWVEESDYHLDKWPSEGGVARPIPTPLPVPLPVALHRGAGATATPMLLRQQVITPVCRNVILPYFTTEVRSEEFREYRQNSMGDIFPYPRVTAGTVYVTAALPHVGNDLPVRGAKGAAPDGRHLDLPDGRLLGVDLPSLARDLFQGTGGGAQQKTVQQKVHRLRDHFRESFRYSNNALWLAGRQPLQKFLHQEKVGDCTYFATATTLILRAGGVSARLAVGFLGGYWDDEKQEAVVRNREAHAWTEVFLPSAGWYPIDATSWVPLDSSYQPPPDALEELKRRLRAGGNPFGTTTGDDSRAPHYIPFEEMEFADPRRPLDDETAPKQKIRMAAERPLDLDENADRGSWIQYMGTFDSEEARELALVSMQEPYAGDLSKLELGARVEAGAAPDDTAEPARGEKRSASMKKLALALRIALATVGLVIISLLIRAFLRPKADQDEEKEEGDEAETSTALDPLARILAALDERIPRDKVLSEYLRLQEALERTRNHRRPHQTPAEHARWVLRQRDDVEKPFRELHRVLYRLLYAGGPVEKRDVTQVVRSCRRLRRLLG